MKKHSAVVGIVLQCLFAAGVLAAGWWLGGFMGLLAGFGVLLACIAMGIFVFYAALHRLKRPLYFNNYPHKNLSKTEIEASAKEIEAEYEAKLKAFGYEDVEITSFDGLKLRGLLVYGKPGENRIAVIAHGYGGYGMMMGWHALYYREKYGFSILLPDQRSHGKSEGKYIGWGWPERRDFWDWFNFLLGKFGPGAQILMQGTSMGGATVMNTSGEDVPPQVKFFVEDCGFTSLFDILAYTIKKDYCLPSFPGVFFGSLVCRLVCRYWFGQAASLKQVGKTSRPIIFMHGDADTVVPPGMLATLYGACASQNKQMFMIPDAAHGWAFSKGAHLGIDDAIAQYISMYMPAGPL